MGIQTTYSFTHDALVQGMIDSMVPSECLTGYSDAAIGFGLGLVYDGEVTDGRSKLALPSATGFTFAGISVFTHKQNTGGDSGLGDLTTDEVARYAIGDDITYGKKGRFVVWSESAVEPGDAVFLRHTANGAGTAPGQFRVDADTDGADQIARAQWVTKITAAGLVVLEINLP